MSELSRARLGHIKIHVILNTGASMTDPSIRSDAVLTKRSSTGVLFGSKAVVSLKSTPLLTQA